MSDNTPISQERIKNPEFAYLADVPEYITNVPPSEVQEMMNNWKKNNQQSRKAHPMDLSYLFE